MFFGRGLVAAAVIAMTACSTSATGTGNGGGGGGGTSGTGGRSTLDVPAFCDRLVNTCADKTQTVADCTKTFSAVRVAQPCIDAVNAATCADLTSPGSAVLGTCFPPCDATGTQKCNGDGTITECVTNGGSGAQSVTFDCGSVCTAGGFKSWSGTCGTTYQTQTSDKDKCWCQ